MACKQLKACSAGIHGLNTGAHTGGMHWKNDFCPPDWHWWGKRGQLEAALEFARVKWDGIYFTKCVWKTESFWVECLVMVPERRQTAQRGEGTDRPGWGPACTLFQNCCHDLSYFRRHRSPAPFNTVSSSAYANLLSTLCMLPWVVTEMLTFTSELHGLTAALGSARREVHFPDVFQGPHWHFRKRWLIKKIERVCSKGIFSFIQQEYAI